MIKYGVIGVDSLLDDLQTWRHLYAAGRMQKPVLTLVCDPSVHAAQVSNIRCAAAAALLLLPERFSTQVGRLLGSMVARNCHPIKVKMRNLLLLAALQELLSQIVSLSYRGDVRMGIAEDPHKVQSW
jgi:translocator assembly and maintenance protein 41